MGYIDTMNIGGTDYDIKDKNAVDSRPLIATVETTSTASKAYAVGDQFIYNNLLYKATAAISSGGTITPGSNCELAGDITSQISSLDIAKGTVSMRVNGNNTTGSANIDLSPYHFINPPIVNLSLNTKAGSFIGLRCQTLTNTSMDVRLSNTDGYPQDVTIMWTAYRND